MTNCYGWRHGQMQARLFMAAIACALSAANRTASAAETAPSAVSPGKPPASVTPSEPRPATPATPEQLKAWAGELTSRKAATMHRAVTSLIAVGEPAVAYLEKAIPDGHPLAQAAYVDALLDIAVAGRLEARPKALAALERASQGRNNGARHASVALFRVKKGFAGRDHTIDPLAAAEVDLGVPKFRSDGGTWSLTFDTEDRSVEFISNDNNRVQRIRVSNKSTVVEKDKPKFFDFQGESFERVAAEHPEVQPIYKLYENQLKQYLVKNENGRLEIKIGGPGVPALPATPTDLQQYRKEADEAEYEVAETEARLQRMLQAAKERQIKAAERVRRAEEQLRK